MYYMSFRNINMIKEPKLFKSDVRYHKFTKHYFWIKTNIAGISEHKYYSIEYDISTNSTYRWTWCRQISPEGWTEEIPAWLLANFRDTDSYYTRHVYIVYLIVILARQIGLMKICAWMS